MRPYSGGAVALGGRHDVDVTWKRGTGEHGSVDRGETRSEERAVGLTTGAGAACAAEASSQLGVGGEPDQCRRERYR